MDFDYAVNKLNREHGALRSARQTKLNAKLRIKQQQGNIQKLAEERRKKQEAERSIRDKAKSVITSAERELNIVSIPSKDSDYSSLKLKPVSIWGEGDKITLPTSVLEFLMQKYNHDLSGIGQPLTFRVGVLNPTYSINDAPVCQSIQNYAKRMSSVDLNNDDYDDDAVDKEHMYLEELKHKYLTYTYATVQEFTQEEGYIGLPSIIAHSLCRCKHEFFKADIATTRTVDPAERKEDMEVDNMSEVFDNHNKTTGHIAWGAFDVPDMEVEICLVSLPKGKGCTLKPSNQAIQNGFYGLKDVKLALEQSLTRTRASLTLGDTIHTWHRGIQYDMEIVSVEPGTFGSISCVNTDIEITFAPQPKHDALHKVVSTGRILSNVENEKVSCGFRLNEFETAKLVATEGKPCLSKMEKDACVPVTLREEPPIDQVENICIILVRSSEKSQKRRFDIHESTMRDLFDFAASLNAVANDRPFQLVSTFPRQVFEFSLITQMNDANSKETSLFDAGLRQGQQVLLVEWL